MRDSWLTEVSVATGVLSICASTASVDPAQRGKPATCFRSRAAQARRARTKVLRSSSAARRAESQRAQGRSRSTCPSRPRAVRSGRGDTRFATEVNGAATPAVRPAWWSRACDARRPSCAPRPVSGASCEGATTIDDAASPPCRAQSPRNSSLHRRSEARACVVSVCESRHDSTACQWGPLRAGASEEASRTSHRAFSQRRAEEERRLVRRSPSNASSASRCASVSDSPASRASLTASRRSHKAARTSCSRPSLQPSAYAARSNAWASPVGCGTEESDAGTSLTLAVMQTS